MLRLALVTAMLFVLAGGAAEAKVGCASGTTAFAGGGLRIFGVHYATPDESGFVEYACLGRRRPLIVGGVGATTGTGSGATPAYAIGGGGRYLAAYDVSDGEGGPSASIGVIDLHRRRTVNYVNVACCGFVPAFRVASDATLVFLAEGESLVVKARGRRERTLSAPGAIPRDLAMAGHTVYWSEGGQPRSASLGGSVTSRDRMLEPVRLRRHGGACAAARGRTIAASGSVRVVRRGKRRFGCRIGGEGRFRVGAAGTPAPRIAGDRWLLLRGGAGARVVDSRTGRTVTVAASAARAELLPDGTLAWTQDGGRLLAQRPGGAAVELAAAGASALAVARRAIYWTEGGAPRRAARSLSNPG